MVNLRLFRTAVLALAYCWSANAVNDATASSPTAAKAPSSEQAANSEMRELFAADQAIRLEVEKRGGWIAVKDDKAFLKIWENGELESFVFNLMNSLTTIEFELVASRNRFLLCSIHFSALRQTRRFFKGSSFSGNCYFQGI